MVVANGPVEGIVRGTRWSWRDVRICGVKRGSAATIVEPATTAIAVDSVPVELIWERRLWEHGDTLVVNALSAVLRWEYRLGIAKGCAGRSTTWAA